MSGSMRLILVLGPVSSQSVDGQVYVSEATQIVNTIFHQYQAAVPPDMNLLMDVDVKLVHLAGLDVTAQVMETALDMTVRWEDVRLKWNHRKVTELKVDTDAIWHPDVSITNAVDKPVEVDDSFFVVRSNGQILWSRRLRVITSCLTNMTSLAQECDIEIGSSTALESNLLYFNPNNTVFSTEEGVFSHDWRVISSSRLNQEQSPQVICHLLLEKATECCSSTSASQSEEVSDAPSSAVTLTSVVPLLVLIGCARILAQL